MNSHHHTDDEYERLIDLDNAEETGDPFLRPGPCGKEGEPTGEITINIQLPLRHRLIQPRVMEAERVPPVCFSCHRRRDHCICLP